MPGITVVASRRARSAGTLLVFGGGLALYQMTSLVLGPAGSRALHLSLTIPAVDADELSEPLPSDVNLVLGRLADPAPAPSVSAPLAPPLVAGTSEAHRATAPAVPVMPVGSQPPTTHPSGHPLPPIVRLPVPPADAPKVDDSD